MSTVIAQTDAEIRQCLPAMLALRQHLSVEQAFDMIRFQQANDGYVLAYVQTGDATEPAPAVVGYRYMNLLYSGKTLYIDDLSTLPGRVEKDTPVPCLISSLPKPGKRTASVYRSIRDRTLPGMMPTAFT